MSSEPPLPELKQTAVICESQGDIRTPVVPTFEWSVNLSMCQYVFFVSIAIRELLISVTIGKLSVLWFGRAKAKSFHLSLTRGSAPGPRSGHRYRLALPRSPRIHKSNPHLISWIVPTFFTSLNTYFIVDAL